MKKKDNYDIRGVSASKEDVHNAIKDIDKGIFPDAFCKVVPDILTGDPDYCNIMHADGAGTKSSLAYLYWKETGDMSVWKGIAQDALVMNLDDLLCVGATENILVSSTIGRNRNLVPGEVIGSLINGFEELLEEFRAMGITVFSTGGETADVGDLVRTIIVDVTMTTRMRRDRVKRIGLRPGDVIIGLSSTGKASYEQAENSGMGSNGLTSARHDIFANYVARRYPEAFDPSIPVDKVYNGKHRLTQMIPGTGMDAGRFVLSPTRTYAPVIKKILALPRQEDIHGMIHCTGGAQTKVMGFSGNLRVIKDNLFETPEVFKMIQQASETTWEEMYKVFNMGHRFELYVPEGRAEEIIGIAEDYGVHAKIIGHCEEAQQKELIIKTPHGEFRYG